MRLCIVTLYKSINSGSYWQAKALEIALKKLGHEVWLYDVQYPLASKKMKYWTILDTIASNGISESLKYLRCLRDFSALQRELPVVKDRDLDNIDCFILGSDTIWNLESKTLAANFDVFWGTKFASHKIITYAGSAANTSTTCLEQYPKAQEAIALWSAISVRDHNTEVLLHSVTDKPLHRVCDPTMLLCRDDYLSLCKTRQPGKYIFLYLFKDLSEGQSEELTQFAKANGFAVIQGVNGKKNRAANYSVANSPNVFLSHMLGAEYVITDTFHGTVFSLNLNKQFVSINRNKQKVNDILESFEFQDRLVSDGQPLLKVLFTEIDYKNRMGSIEVLRSASWRFLQDTLGGET